MAREPDNAERFAFEIVRRATGAVVEHTDDGRAQGQVDGRILYPDGTEGAIEVTTAANPRAMEIESTAVGTSRSAPGIRQRWTVQPGPTIQMQTLWHHLPLLLAACERQAVARIEQVHPESAAEDAALEWHETANCTVTVLPGSSGRGTVEVLPPAIAAFLHDPYGQLCAWAQETLTGSSTKRRVEKLGRCPVPERHLFLVVHESGAPAEIVHGLACAGTASLPAGELRLPPAVTHLWLAGRWKTGEIIAYSSSAGWLRWPFAHLANVPRSRRPPPGLLALARRDGHATP